VSDPRHQLQADLAERYVLERELGRGGMATVYLAQGLHGTTDQRRKSNNHITHVVCSYLLSTPSFELRSL
jgi:serine/threonine protein kinase